MFTFDHHAYLVEGDGEVALIDVREICEKAGIATIANPDFRVYRFATLGIEESRFISEVQIATSFGEGKKIFVIAAESITREAENALLKVFEEPTEGVHFFLIVPDGRRLLPTLLSRLMPLRLKDAASEDSTLNKEASGFLKMSLAERLAFVKEKAEALSDEKISKEDITAFLNVVERALHDRGLTAEASRRPLEAILKVRIYLHNKGSSVKMLLEYVALSL